MAHVTFAIWVNFVLNDPFKFSLPSMDAVGPVSTTCTSFSFDAFFFDIVFFVLVWWAPHSLLARKAVKQALGLWNSVIDRPLFAALASLTWAATLFYWRPIDTCARFNVLTELSFLRLVLHGMVFVSALVIVLGLFYLLPHHVFGTDRHTWVNGKAPAQDVLLISFPYSVVRHPGAAGLLWIYWGAIPSYSANHFFLAFMWSVFAFVGTLLFEERGLRSSEEFGQKYSFYATKVNAFYPSVWCIKLLLGIAKKEEALMKSK